MKILLADDHLLFRQGVRQVLAANPDFDVVGEADNGRSAVELTLSLRPDMVLMDVHMPEMTGTEALREIKQRAPSTLVVMLTIADSDRDLFESVKAGADGYLLKNLTPEELVAAVRAAAAGETPMTPAMATRILREFQRDPGTKRPARHNLSNRELEVLRLAASGMTYREIAAALFVAESTVKNHMRHIMEKLHLRNRTEVVRVALSEGLLDEANLRGSQAE